MLHPHSATGLVDRLGAQGLVERIEDHRDRRRVMLATSAGKLLGWLSPIRREEIRRIRPLLIELERAMQLAQCFRPRDISGERAVLSVYGDLIFHLPSPGAAHAESQPTLTGWPRSFVWKRMTTHRRRWQPLQ
jgi:hypothetical protein